jgi:hypothetical protein
MLIDYMSVGLSPERFWELTPRLYLFELKGAAARITRERGEIWDGAAMSRDGVKMPKRDEYAGVKRKPLPTWQEQLAGWEAYMAYQKRKGR